MKNLKQTRSMKQYLRAAGLAGVLVVAFTACGSDDSADEPVSTDAMEDDAATTDAMEDPATTDAMEDDAMDDPATTDAMEDDAMEDPATTDAMEDGDGDAAPADGGPAAVAIVDFNYDPNPVEVASGTEITWTNEDGFAHTVTADGGDLEFDSGNVAEGETFSMAFDEPGTYAYICTIHNQMKAEIVVS